MKVQVLLPGNNRFPPQPDWVMKLAAPDYQRIARTLDDLGYDLVSTAEHFVAPLEDVPVLGGYWMPATPVMAFLAGATTKLRVDAHVLVMPYHHPLALAKTLAAIDVLSGGRVTLTIGVGHAEREFEVLGVPYNQRGRRTDEGLALMRECWTNATPSFQGDYYQLDGVVFEPRPVQDPMPIIVGGNSKAALRRASRHQGWHPNMLFLTPEKFARGLDFIRSQADFAGKERDFEIVIDLLPPDIQPFGLTNDSERSELRDSMVESIQSLATQGATGIAAPTLPAESLDDYLSSLGWFAEEVLPHVR